MGYLFSGKIADHAEARIEKENLAKLDIYVRQYSDLLDMVQRLHKDFVDRYDRLKETKKAER